MLPRVQRLWSHLGPLCYTLCVAQIPVIITQKNVFEKLENRRHSQNKESTMLGESRRIRFIWEDVGRKSFESDN